MLPPSFRFPPLREGNHVGVWFPRFAGGTMRGFGSPCGQGEPAGGVRKILLGALRVCVYALAGLQTALRVCAYALAGLQTAPRVCAYALDGL